MAKRQNKNERQIKINPDAKEFAKATLKRYKKQNGDYFDSKKELKASYSMYLIDLLPETIEFIVKYGYIDNEEVQGVKTEIYKKINDPDFIKVIKKELKNDNKIGNIKLLPIIIKEILMEAKRVNDQALAENPNAKVYDMTDLVELSQMILKKKIKKMCKVGINSSLAFDTLSIIPCDKALESSQFYRIHTLYECLYEHAKSVAVPFEQIIDILIDEELYPVFITFALLERKEKFLKLTEAQKTLYLDISNWCFKTMEKDLSKEEIESIIKTYVTGRKRDDARGKDGNRRYALSSLSADDYSRITKVINKMTVDDESIKKYL